MYDKIEMSYDNIWMICDNKLMIMNHDICIYISTHDIMKYEWY